MLSAEGDALADLFDEAAELIGYTGAGLVDEQVSAIWSNRPAPVFQGNGGTARQITCEIRFGTIPERPAAKHRITHGGAVWKPVDIAERDDLGSWLVTIERA